MGMKSGSDAGSVHQMSYRGSDRNSRMEDAMAETGASSFRPGHMRTETAAAPTQTTSTDKYLIGLLATLIPWM